MAWGLAGRVTSVSVSKVSTGTVRSVRSLMPGPTIEKSVPVGSHSAAPEPLL